MSHPGSLLLLVILCWVCLYCCPSVNLGSQIVNCTCFYLFWLSSVLYQYSSFSTCLIGCGIVLSIWCLILRSETRILWVPLSHLFHSNKFCANLHMHPESPSVCDKYSEHLLISTSRLWSDYSLHFQGDQLARCSVEALCDLALWFSQSSLLANRVPQDQTHDVEYKAWFLQRDLRPVWAWN